MFTGDLTHTTDDPKERRERMAQFKDIVAGLKVKDVRFMPGEHDASLDSRQGVPGASSAATHYTFDHKGVHFIVLDNVSDPTATDRRRAAARGSRPTLPDRRRTPTSSSSRIARCSIWLPQWDWATPDGAKAIDLLMPHANVTVFYGHIHQEHHHMTGHIAHHAAKGLMFPLPVAKSQPKRTPLPWDPAHPYRGLGFRSVEAEARAKFEITEFPVVKAT